MGNVQFPESYSGQSLDALLAFEDQVDSWQINWLIAEALELKATRLGGFDSLSREEVYIVALRDLVMEVINGGFAQFFINSSRQFAPVIVEALEAINHTRGAAIAADAIRIVREAGAFSEEDVLAAQAKWQPGVSKPEDMPPLWDEMEEQLGPCDSAWYEFESVDPELFEFIKLNRERMSLP